MTTNTPPPYRYYPELYPHPSSLFSSTAQTPALESIPLRDVQPSNPPSRTDVRPSLDDSRRSRDATLPRDLLQNNHNLHHDMLNHELQQEEEQVRLQIGPPPGYTLSGPPPPYMTKSEFLPSTGLHRLALFFVMTDFFLSILVAVLVVAFLIDVGPATSPAQSLLPILYLGLSLFGAIAFTLVGYVFLSPIVRRNIRFHQSTYTYTHLIVCLLEKREMDALVCRRLLCPMVG